MTNFISECAECQGCNQKCCLAFRFCRTGFHERRITSERSSSVADQEGCELWNVLFYHVWLSYMFLAARCSYSTFRARKAFWLIVFISILLYFFRSRAHFKTIGAVERYIPYLCFVLWNGLTGSRSSFTFLEKNFICFLLFPLLHSLYF